MTQRESKRSVVKVLQNINHHQSVSDYVSILIHTYSILSQCHYIKSMNFPLFVARLRDQGEMIKNHSWQNKSLLQTQSSHWHSRYDLLSWSPWWADSTRVSSVQAVNALRTPSFPASSLDADLLYCDTKPGWVFTTMRFWSAPKHFVGNNTAVHSKLITPWLQSLTIHLV